MLTEEIGLNLNQVFFLMIYKSLKADSVTANNVDLRVRDNNKVWC